ncbi:hypothetical protein VTK73DRAFT_5865 [Phialemonium thermophilum]|uniref:Uncharacterized protein n=1 Tax=Phialemonium thermophilum TaxID=223376 RepID=A0ABR3V0H9_9PEZI
MLPTRSSCEGASSYGRKEREKTDQPLCYTRATTGPADGPVWLRREAVSEEWTTARYSVAGRFNAEISWQSYIIILGLSVSEKKKRLQLSVKGTMMSVVNESGS